MTSFPFRWYIPAENPTYLLPLRMEISNCHLIWRRGRDRMVAWKVCDLVRTLLAQWHRRLWSLGRCFSCWDRCGARSNRHGTFHSQCASAFTNLITPGGKSNWVEDKLSPSPELYQHLGPSFFGGVLFRFRMDQLLNSCWLYMIIGGCNIQYIYIYWVLSWIFVVQILFQMFRLGIGILTHTHIPLCCGAEVTKPTFLPFLPGRFNSSTFR